MTEGGATLWYPTARWLYYLAVFLVAGAAVFRWVVLPRAARAAGTSAGVLAARGAVVARAGAVLLALALLGRLYFQTRSLLDPEEPVTVEIVRLVLTGQWGRGWLAQGAAALVALVGWRSVGRTPERRHGLGLALLGSVAVVITSPLTGHATGLPAAGRLGYPMTVLHLTGGASWLGTLGVLWLASFRRGSSGGIPTRHLVAAFSPVALVSSVAAIGLGGLLGWRYLGGLSPLWTTDYGRALLFKVGALVGVAATGAYNWRVVLPRLRQGDEAPIGRTAAAELCIGLLLLAITAVLVSLAAPAEHG